MAENSAIAWTDHTFNPWIGCDEISRACDHCYAKELAERYGWAKWGPKEERHRTKPSNWNKPFSWDRKALKDGTRPKVFCLSLGDFADNKVPQSWRDDLKDVIRKTPNLDWLILSKRPQNYIPLYGREFFEECKRRLWIGCTAENQEEYDRRRLHVLAVPAAVHFFSVEPMMGPVIRDIANERDKNVWYICGGESGAERRPMEMEWIESLRASCAETKTPFFFKQDTGRTPGQQGRASDALWATKQFPVAA